MQAEKPNPEPTEWQPIETAPKAEADQDDIWIWAARRGTKLPMLTTWDAEEGHWYTFNLALETGMRRREPGWKWEPTHWMPLQEVPKMSNSETTDWQPIGDAPPMIDEIAHYTLPPQLGQHIGRCYTLPDGRWVVIKFSNPGTEPESYFILPEPPL